jgi:methionyl aminopeptidase
LIVNGKPDKNGKGEDEDSGDEVEDTPGTTSLPPTLSHQLTNPDATKKKKKKPKKKKAGGAGALKQTSPPTIGLSKFFPSGEYPLGEIREYKDQ